MSTRLENGDDVIGIVICFEIEKERRKPDYPQGRGGENGAFEAVSGLARGGQRVGTKRYRPNGTGGRRGAPVCRRVT